MHTPCRHYIVATQHAFIKYTIYLYTFPCIYSLYKGLGNFQMQIYYLLHKYATWKSMEDL